MLLRHALQEFITHPSYTRSFDYSPVKPISLSSCAKITFADSFQPGTNQEHDPEKVEEKAFAFKQCVRRSMLKVSEDYK